MSVRYISLEPVNLKDTYSEFDTIDFDVVYAGRKLGLNNIRLAATIQTPNAIAGAGELRVDNNNTDFFLDNMVGAHSFIQQISTEFSNAGAKSGVAESLNEYPRYCKMYYSASQGANDQNSSASACELRSPNIKYSNVLLRGGQTGLPDGHEYIESQGQSLCNFSVRPRFCLNSVSSQGSPMLSERQVGRCRISIRLARFEDVFSGSDAVANITSYQLSDVRLLYQTYSDDGQDMPLVMRTKANIKQNVNGNAITLNARLPIQANSMTASFFPVADMNSAKLNTLACPEPPQVNRVEFSFNDSTNAYISYELRDRNSILQRAVQSIGDRDMTNDNTLANIKNADQYIIGLNFGNFINLARQKFSVLINSEIGSNAQNYTLYSYFHGVMEM
jgi:hypothetical protein